MTPPAPTLQIEFGALLFLHLLPPVSTLEARPFRHPSFLRKRLRHDNLELLHHLIRLQRNHPQRVPKEYPGLMS